MHTHINRTQGGNAVTLTLLGLAVAILAGVAVLYFVGASVPLPPSLGVDEQATTTEPTPEPVDPRAGWNTYENDEFEFSVMYPPGWIVATGTVLGSPVVTLYDAVQEVGTTSASDVHELPVRVSLYPQGLPTGGKGEQKAPSMATVDIQDARAIDYVLGSGKPWATVITFPQHPESWNESGFAYARVAIQEEALAYMRGDTGISPEEFDPYSGDTLVTHGFVDSAEWSVVSEVLRSFSFTSETTPSEESGTASLITVTSPLPGTTVASPLLVRGEAHGSWYFEASFPVRLVTSDGSVLAEVPATALDDWMQDANVPFEVSVVFADTTATSGTLILRRDNPSGLPEYDASVEIPVVFSN